jgi:hypothetical protein
VSSKWPTERTLLEAIELAGRIYAIGGVQGDQQPFLDTVERFDPNSNTWTAVASMGIGRRNAGVVTATGKIVHIRPR